LILTTPQFAKQLSNAVIFGTAGTDEGLKAITANGANHAFNHRQDGYLDQVLELTEGQGIDIILEMLANVNLGLRTLAFRSLTSSAKDCKVLALGGRVCIIGNRGTLDFNPRYALIRLSPLSNLPGTLPHKWSNTHLGT
jgi:NADPH2:quinone reductase